MSNDTGNDQNLFTLKITEGRVAKLWHYIVKLHVQGFTEHPKRTKTSVLKSLPQYLYWNRGVHCHKVHDTRPAKYC
jgi:hypothetical protein